MLEHSHYVPQYVFWLDFHPFHRNMQAQNDPGLVWAPHGIAHSEVMLRDLFTLALHSPHHRKYFKSTLSLTKAEFTKLGYLQRDPTETNTAALHSSHILAVTHQTDEHHYRGKHTSELKNHSSEKQIWLHYFGWVSLLPIASHQPSAMLRND